MPDLSDLVVIFEEIVLSFRRFTQTLFTGVASVVPEYESSWMMIYAHMRTGKRVVDVCHCVNVAFLTSFFLYAECRGDLIS